MVWDLLNLENYSVKSFSHGNPRLRKKKNYHWRASSCLALSILLSSLAHLSSSLSCKALINNVRYLTISTISLPSYLQNFGKKSLKEQFLVWTLYEMTLKGDSIPTTVTFQAFRRLTIMCVQLANRLP